jgi:DNA repair protein RadC
MKTSKQASKEICPFCQTFSSKMRHAHILKTSKDALIYLSQFEDKRQEHIIALSLDSAQRLIKRRIITVGLLDTALAHPREIFSGAIEDRAASVVIAHNHPSGEAMPSKQDIDTTQQLVAAGILLGIPLRDHIIIAKDAHYSFKQHGLI